MPVDEILKPYPDVGLPPAGDGKWYTAYDLWLAYRKGVEAGNRIGVQAIEDVIEKGEKGDG